MLYARGTNSRRDDFPTFTAQNPPPELPGLPTITELPPVIPQTGPRASSAQATGPRRAHVALGRRTAYVGWDRDGITCFVDRTTTGLLWTLQTPLFTASSIAVDGQGRIYLTGTRGAGSQLVCLSD